MPSNALLLRLGAPAGAAVTGTLVAPIAAAKTIGDGVIVTTQCHGNTGSLCRGTAGLSLAEHHPGAPRLLGSRGYLQLAGPARDLTLYLSAPALRYLHGKRGLKAILTLVSQVSGHGTRRATEMIVLNEPRGGAAR